MALRQPVDSLIHLEAGHGHWERATRLLEALGGRRCYSAGGVVYRFLTSPMRDIALGVVREKFGWTIAEPRDGVPWMTGPSRSTASTREPAA